MFRTFDDQLLAASLTRKKEEEEEGGEKRPKSRSDTELTHRVQAAEEDHGVRFVRPACVLLRVQRVRRTDKIASEKILLAAIRNERDKIVDLFPDGAADRLTFQSVEIERLDFQLPPAR